MKNSYRSKVSKNIIKFVPYSSNSSLKGNTDIRISVTKIEMWTQCFIIYANSSIKMYDPQMFPGLNVLMRVHCIWNVLNTSQSTDLRESKTAEENVVE